MFHPIYIYSIITLGKHCFQNCKCYSATESKKHDMTRQSNNNPSRIDRRAVKHIARPAIKPQVTMNNY